MIGNTHTFQQTLANGVCFRRFGAARSQNIVCMCIGLKYKKRTQHEPIITCPLFEGRPSFKLWSDSDCEFSLYPNTCNTCININTRNFLFARIPE